MLLAEMQPHDCWIVCWFVGWFAGFLFLSYWFRIDVVLLRGTSSHRNRAQNA